MIFPEDKNKEAAALLYIFAEYPELEYNARITAKNKEYFQVNAFQEQLKTLDGVPKIFAHLAVAIFNQDSFPLHLFNGLSDEELKTAFEAIKHCKDDKAIYNLPEYALIIKENAEAEQYTTEEADTEDYLGQTQVANMLQEKGIDLDRRKIAVYYQRGHLPTPAVMLGKTPGWKKETIEKWIEDYEAGRVLDRRKR